VYTLITAANSPQAYRLKNVLGVDKVLLGDYLELPDLLVQAGKMLRLPGPQSLNYTHEMLALCLDRNIDTIYALRDEEKQLLFNDSQLFREYDISIKITDEI
jgi:hypothetical protein